ncbi:hypothetical protein [Amantichitinum ursilacus]|uniref:Uncharacterized protein n=1 Tax=Amantichitinum ursilacus TaxID=857265 RepID=A0A0N0GP57_9NEIS|nr:hypothetical protein [Amantichitinum ursilacus]KPC53174.1 hypothetical protein WG78_08790 [Amantichitinum ursilacus]
MREQAKKNGGEIFFLLRDYFPLDEWRKYCSRTMKIKDANGTIIEFDRTTLPPFTTIRFRDGQSGYAEVLKTAISGYAGEVLWNIFEYKRVSGGESNWIIEPQFVSLLRNTECPPFESVSDYVQKKYPEFSKKAHADLISLVSYLTLWLTEHGFKPVYAV